MLLPRVGRDSLHQGMRHDVFHLEAARAYSLAVISNTICVGSHDTLIHVSRIRDDVPFKVSCAARYGVVIVTVLGQLLEYTCIRRDPLLQ